MKLALLISAGINLCLAAIVVLTRDYTAAFYSAAAAALTFWGIILVRVK